jgi:hypothetical protein
VIDSRDGTSYATGLRIDGPHCRRCGRPNAGAPQRLGSVVLHRSSCCGDVICSGAVNVDPWVAHTSRDRTVWACHRQLADKHLGEPTWMPPLPTPAA